MDGHSWAGGIGERIPDDEEPIGGSGRKQVWAEESSGLDSGRLCILTRVVHSTEYKCCC